MERGQFVWRPQDRAQPHCQRGPASGASPPPQHHQLPRLVGQPGATGGQLRHRDFVVRDAKELHQQGPGDPVEDRQEVGGPDLAGSPVLALAGPTGHPPGPEM